MFIHSIYYSLPLLIPNSHPIAPSLLATASLFSISSVSHFSHFYLFFNWSIIVLQCCASFC